MSRKRWHMYVLPIVLVVGLTLGIVERCIHQSRHHYPARYHDISNFVDVENSGCSNDPTHESNYSVSPASTMPSSIHTFSSSNSRRYSDCTHSITGRVVQSSGSPLIGATVVANCVDTLEKVQLLDLSTMSRRHYDHLLESLTFDSFRESPSCTTDSDGYFDLLVAPNAAYSISVEQPHYLITLGDKVAGPFRAGDTVTLHALRNTEVVLDIVLSDQQVPAHASVTWRSHAHFEQREWTPESPVVLLPSGVATINVTVGGTYVSQPKWVPININPATANQISLVLCSVSSADIVILASENELLSERVRVGIRPLHSRPTDRSDAGFEVIAHPDVDTRASCLARVDDIAPGSYEVSVWRSHHVSAPDLISIVDFPSGNSRFHLELPPPPLSEFFHVVACGSKGDAAPNAAFNTVTLDPLFTSGGFAISHRIRSIETTNNEYLVEKHNSDHPHPETWCSVLRVSSGDLGEAFVSPVLDRTIYVTLRPPVRFRITASGILTDDCSLQLIARAYWCPQTGRAPMVEVQRAIVDVPTVNTAQIVDAYLYLPPDRYHISVHTASEMLTEHLYDGLIAISSSGPQQLCVESSKQR